ncbi:DNA-binding response regulator [Haloferula helveola]|uniref:DNA-binding response regulator n=1 Tax=Haloferula helveola TaxID=490095 RepID=A0ABM7RCN5_9BACT|nr:DNA-binding response regulator [Haloferula helveola]
MSQIIRVLVVDDHPIVRKGMAQIIGEDPAMEVVGNSSNGEEALSFLLTNPADVVVSDYEMPGMDGIELARRLAGLKPPLPLVLLTMHKDEDLFNAATDAGICAYLLKDEVLDNIAQGIRAASGGESYVSPSLAQFVMRRSRSTQDLKERHTGLDSLTPAERAVLKRIALNLASKEIASELHISPHTVTTHRRNIAQKLELTGKHPLLNFALANRSAILSLPD